MSTFEDGIRYEVALEILGQSLQPFMQSIENERKKPEPSQALMNYCKARIKAIGDLQDALRPSDADTINRILDKEDAVFRR